jgi:hypothetical protein
MTTDTTSHDRLFKAILGEFFPEFIELFFPQVAAYLEPDSIEFLPLELFADLIEGDTFEADLVVKVKFRGQDSYFIIHVEHQTRYYQDIDRRVFQYFALLHRDHGLPVYPIVIFSHRSPKEPGDRSYRVEFADWEVLRFNYRAIRLNHLNWRDFIDRKNPIASAFMAKMKINRQERTEAKLACLISLAELNLNPAQLYLLSGFIDTYLRLEAEETERLLAKLDKIEPSKKEKTMQIVNSWEERGEKRLLLRMLNRKFQSLAPELEAKITTLSVETLENLGEALLDFQSETDLRNWLNANTANS